MKKYNPILQPISFVTLALAVGVGAVHAETALEQHLLLDPAPHTLAAKGGIKVMAHYATINGYLEGQPRNAERLVELKNTVNGCLKNPNPMALPLQPPTEWPDLLNGNRVHTYTTERYSISYRRDWTYGPTMPNCSVLEGSGYTAILKSSAGQCQMDLIEKKAWGQCNMAAHRAAKPLPSMLPPPGPLQVIAGLRCGVLKVFNTEMCLAVDGKMKPSYPLVVGTSSEFGIREKAVTAALDIEVSESIFAPHLQAGFTVTDKRP